MALLVPDVTLANFGALLLSATLAIRMITTTLRIPSIATPAFPRSAIPAIAWMGGGLLSLTTTAPNFPSAEPIARFGVRTVTSMVNMPGPRKSVISVIGLIMRMLRTPITATLAFHRSAIPVIV